MTGNGTGAAPGAGFRENHVEADGFRIRYAEAGEGPALVHLHGAGGLRLSPAHDLLAQHFRVIAFEMPGDRKSTRLNSSHIQKSRMPSSA